MPERSVDYSLYLVTDSTPAVLGGKDICEVVRKALKGGVTVVQYRDKTSDTGILIETATKLHEITREYGVPLLINDRVDVCLAVGCEGVHVGQDDMDLATARRLLGRRAIIGVSASTPNEALLACKAGADYLGLGAVFATSTKKDTRHILGIAGLRHLLEVMETNDYSRDVPAVCIGGINGSNLQRVLYQSSTSTKSLAGVAVVSALMAAADAESEAKSLLGKLRSPGAPFSAQEDNGNDGEPNAAAGPDEVAALIPAVIKAVHDATPLSHNMTNLVVQNIAANVALAVGASPIMSSSGDEAADLSKLGGALVINMGTVTTESLENYIKALGAYNAAGRPVVFDPVGAGATAIRRAAVKKIMGAGYIDVIKGNQAEIQTLLGAASSSTATTTTTTTTTTTNTQQQQQQQQQQRGVDSGSSTLGPEALASLARDLAAREKCVVVVTGPTDYASDGRRTFAIKHGHPLLGQVTGTGCCLGTVISAAVAAYKGDKLAAAIAGMVLFEVAAERAAAQPAVKGPGTFVPVFLDELSSCRTMAASGEMDWLKEYKIEKAL